MTYTSAYIALGANVSSRFGSPEVTVRLALQHLAENDVSIRSVSHLYETPPVSSSSNSAFVNAVTEVNTSRNAQSLLELLHKLEASFGRVRVERWGARCLDLDLLAFGDQIQPNRERVVEWMKLPLREQLKRAPSELILPHPRCHERSFVLIPWLDIAPQWRHPILGKTVRELASALPEQDRMQVKKIGAPEA